MSELAHGMLLQDQGRLAEAESCFYSVLASEPENDFVYGRLALCQINQDGRRHDALTSIDRAIAIRADEPFYHSIRALVLSDLRRGKEAITAAEAAIAIDPDDSFALSAMASAWCSLDRWAEGEEWARRSLTVDADNTMAANLLTHTLRMQGKSVENAAAVAQLLANDPESSLAHVNAGWSALQRNKSREAEVHFREALRLDPDSEIAREGLLESFRARSLFYRLYLSYCFYMQRFTGGKQWAIVIGIYVVYQFARRALESISPLLAGAFVVLWLALVMWVWLAPGVGNFLIALDRSARLALKRGELWQGLSVGLGLLIGVSAMLVSWLGKYDPAILLGLGALVSTVPASLAFGNDSKKGRLVFGSVAALVYISTVALFIIEAIRYPSEEFLPFTTQLGLVALVSAILCTWLGNVRSLRQSEAG